MNHPPYHLRVNKSVDRFLLIDLLGQLQKKFDLSEYTYYGFGGPFLEDCRLINHYFPEIRIVSIEKDLDTYKRQEFHRFTRNLYIEHIDFDDFLAGFSGAGKSIFWLDFTNFNLACFHEFMALLDAVDDYSIVRITLMANIPKYLLKDNVSTKTIKDYMIRFKEKFRPVIPSSFNESCFALPANYIRLIQDMIRVQAEKALPAAGDNVFQILNSAYYSDGTTMLSLTGIISPLSELDSVNRLFQDWPHANLDWKDPLPIDLPILSIKERLKLERLLPSIDIECQDLSSALGYKIAGDDCANLQKLDRYRYFHRYYPSFAKIII